MKADNCDFDKAPTFVASIEPDLKIIKVGMHEHRTWRVYLGYHQYLS